MFHWQIQSEAFLEMGRKGWPPTLDRKLDGILQEIPTSILTTKTNSTHTK